MCLNQMASPVQNLPYDFAYIEDVPEVITLLKRFPDHPAVTKLPEHQAISPELSGAVSHLRINSFLRNLSYYLDLPIRVRWATIARCQKGYDRDGMTAKCPPPQGRGQRLAIPGSTEIAKALPLAKEALYQFCYLSITPQQLQRWWEKNVKMLDHLTTDKASGPAKGCFEQSTIKSSSFWSHNYAPKLFELSKRHPNVHVIYVEVHFGGPSEESAQGFVHPDTEGQKNSWTRKLIRQMHHTAMLLAPSQPATEEATPSASSQRAATGTQQLTPDPQWPNPAAWANQPTAPPTTPPLVTVI
ncbi:hypothetical protein DL764_000661 [Monosporascus ibericus]|uniref:Uncharacterized protein n=1 Tax=Monosporascus ibericus TaxID=155417 RepID=A0A4Q4TUH6_9PEZI|nr:hypothetical protein DL764_000661 [Monosporascus ibericus]